ncbi:hypothetical protein N7495_006241 [Penicillium taxi]|uniref:uncharacterized protein n=1 Tax=Penicillium taxi TaxID=168475 RepID=UPI002545527A|nr:uncharacterized protein N7495_006241 [Penicillium taxi]KAJ5894550.1 hypothetical protein N7495_006241 [Penicillium taxi]
MAEDPNFIINFQATLNSQESWSTRIICFRADSPKTIPACNKEIVTSRLHNQLGHYLDKMLQAQQINVQYGGFKSANINYSGKPDLAILDKVTIQVMGVGEVKTPWVWEHDLEGLDDAGRTIAFAQTLGYMHELHLKHGFITNYEQTIFLEQIMVNGQVTVLYSPVIRTCLYLRALVYSQP